MEHIISSKSFSCCKNKRANISLMKRIMNVQDVFCLVQMDWPNLETRTKWVP